MARNETGKEAFLPNHLLLADLTLLLTPQVALSPLTLFVCTYVAKLVGIGETLKSFSDFLCMNVRGPLVAINSNFGHACQPGFEHLLKSPPLSGRTPARGRARKVQGDGTCFNSAVEPILSIDFDSDKIYKVKCFPTTGETQVPGVIRGDLSDGHAVLVAFVTYLNSLADLSAPPRSEVAIFSEQPKMLNYKFRVVRTSPRILVCLRGLAAYMHALEVTKAVEGGENLTEAQAALFAGWPAVLLPPYPVRETKPPTDDVKVSFRFRGADRAPRINIFQEGKINILGADSVESAQKIYDFFVELFTVNWPMLVCIQPRRAHERRPAPARVPTPAGEEEVPAAVSATR